MSGTEEKDDQHDDARPMLVIGQDYPDVEDTTPEELRRREEEARREIAEARRRAQEEIERRRREAEREIAELEREKERELAERERALDRTQRKLYKRESRLLRQGSGGSDRRRIVPRPARVPLSRTGLRRSGWGRTLGALGAGALLLGMLTSVPGGDETVRDELVLFDRARVLWLESGLAADEAIALRMSGQEVPAGPEDPDNVRLAREAVALTPDDDEHRADQAEESTTQMLAEGTSDVRALTLWTELHDRSGYAVGAWEVEDLAEEQDGAGAWTYVWLVLGVLSLAALAALALVARSWSALPLLVLATTLGVAGLAVVAAGDAALDGATAAHGQADDALDDIHSQVARDLEVVYGTSSSIFSGRPDYWTRNPFYDELPGARPYLVARAAVGDAAEQGETAAHAAAPGLVAAAQEVFDSNVPALEARRAELVEALAAARGRWGLGAGLLAGGAAAGVAGLLLARGRDEP